MFVYERHPLIRDEVRNSRPSATVSSREWTVGIYNALDVPERAGPTWCRRKG